MVSLMPDLQSAGDPTARHQVQCPLCMLARSTCHSAAVCRFYDVKVGGGQTAKVGDRVAVHYEARWRGVTFMTSRLVLRRCLVSCLKLLSCNDRATRR